MPGSLTDTRQQSARHLAVSVASAWPKLNSPTTTSRCRHVSRRLTVETRDRTMDRTRYPLAASQVGCYLDDHHTGVPSPKTCARAQACMAAMADGGETRQDHSKDSSVEVLLGGGPNRATSPWPTNHASRQSTTETTNGCRLRASHKLGRGASIASIDVSRAERSTRNRSIALVASSASTRISGATPRGGSGLITAVPHSPNASSSVSGGIGPILRSRLSTWPLCLSHPDCTSQSQRLRSSRT